MLCFRCWHWLPPESRYCGICQRSFNSRVCPDNHDNPLWGPQQSCIVCNKPLLYPGVPGLPMSWLARGGTLLLLGALLYQAILHLNWILASLWNAAGHLLGFALLHIPAEVYRFLSNVIAWWVALYLLSHLLPKEMGSPFRSGLVRVVQSAFRLSGSLLLLLGKGFFSLLWAAMRPRKRLVTKTSGKRRREADEDDDEHEA